MERRVGLDDRAFFRPALQLFDERRLARLQRLGDLRVNAERRASGVYVRSHLLCSEASSI
jgi:hypothetical protein